MTSLKTSIKTITYLSDTGCLEIQGASLVTFKKYLIYRSQCRVMEYMYTTIFFFTFNYRIHYKTKLKKLLESELLIYF